MINLHLMSSTLDLPEQFREVERPWNDFQVIAILDDLARAIEHDVIQRRDTAVAVLRICSPLAGLFGVSSSDLVQPWNRVMRLIKGLPKET